MNLKIAFVLKYLSKAKAVYRDAFTVSNPEEFLKINYPGTDRKMFKLEEKEIH